MNVSEISLEEKLNSFLTVGEQIEFLKMENEKLKKEVQKKKDKESSIT